MTTHEQLKQVLTPVKRGDPVNLVANSDRINALQDAVLYLMSGSWLSTGKGLRKGFSGGRISLRMGDVRAGRGGGDYSVWNYSTDVREGRAAIMFHDGLVNNILASNADTWIGLKTGKNYLFAVAKGTGTGIESVQIISDPAMQRGRLIEAKNVPPADVPVFIALAEFKDQTVNVRRVRYRNVIATPVETRRESRTPPGPGEEPFIRYYAWQVNDAP
jgi:hypothetical protein